MTVLSRGANAPLMTGPVEIAVTGARAGSVDLMAFQLGADRKVRGDGDFVFFNQPSSPEGAVRLAAADRITADLTKVPASIVTLAIAVALDDAVTGSLAAVPGLGVSVSGDGSPGVDPHRADPHRPETHRAPASGLTVERAAVLVEIYRRDGGWKVRNVSAGWADGLSALAAEHGVGIEEQSDVQISPQPPAQQPTPRRSVQQSPQQSVLQGPGHGQPAAQGPGHPRPVSVGHRSYPTPGGFLPPGGRLVPPAPFVAPTPGGWPAPGGMLTWPQH